MSSPASDLAEYKAIVAPIGWQATPSTGWHSTTSSVEDIAGCR